jgi:hypothetical protein
VTYSIAATPAFAALPLHADSQDRSNPRTTPFPVVIKSTSSTSIAGSEPPTRPFPPPDNSISTAVLQRAANRILRHSGSIGRYPHRLLFVFHRSGLIPRLLHCRRLALFSSRYPSSSTNNSSQRVIATFSSSPPISAATLNTSRSNASLLSPPYDGRSRRVGLSLLHDLVNGMDSSDEDNILSRLWYSRSMAR